MKPIQAKEERRPFLSDTQELRRPTREHMDQGTVTNDYKSGREAVIQILNTRGHSQYAEAASLVNTIEKILVAERIAVDIYSEIIRNLGNDNPTTRIMLENIATREDEHAENMKRLLIAIGEV
jgi:rubrerythrin